MRDCTSFLFPSHIHKILHHPHTEGDIPGLIVKVLKLQSSPDKVTISCPQGGVSRNQATHTRARLRDQGTEHRQRIRYYICGPVHLDSSYFICLQFFLLLLFDVSVVHIKAQKKVTLPLCSVAYHKRLDYNVVSTSGSLRMRRDSCRYH